MWGYGRSGCAWGMGLPEPIVTSAIETIARPVRIPAATGSIRRYAREGLLELRVIDCFWRERLSERRNRDQ